MIKFPVISSLNMAIYCCDPYFRKENVIQRKEDNNIHMLLILLLDICW